MAEIILTNVFAILVILTLLISSNIDVEAKNESTKKFNMLLFSVMLFTIINLLSEVLDGIKGITFLLYVISTFSFIAIDLILISFSNYFVSLLNENNKGKTKNDIMIVKALCILRIIISIILTFFKKLFIIDENGYYVEKEWSFVPYIISVIVMAYLLYLAIKCKNNFSKKQFIAIIIYISLPVIPIIIELYTDLYSISIISMTLTMLIIYVFIQATTIKDIKTKEQLLEELSSTDLLTGLNNRRSYYKKISRIDLNENIGVLFFDINGLKYTNDHYGHEKGDELIKKFANILLSFYREEDVFRISGDEFVVITSNINEDEFNKNSKELRIVLNENNNIASSGYAYGIGKSVEYLISEAERFMYKEKKKIHSKRQEFYRE